MEDLSQRRLYLHCEECESKFLDPAQLENSLLTLTEDYEYKFADLETIENLGLEIHRPKYRELTSSFRQISALVIPLFLKTGL
jgi:hypothetical protein